MMTARLVPAFVLGAAAGELAIGPAAAWLDGRVQEPAMVAVIALPCLVGLVVGVVGMLVTPGSGGA